MGRRGRTQGRRSGRIDKAMSHGAAVGFASANRGNAPRTVALGDAINAATVPGRQLVIDDETLHMVPMMRDPRDRTGFGPSNPLDPAPIDPSRRDTGRPEPRLTEYPVSWNLPGSAAQPIPWATLRAAAENVDIMRRCISVRQEQLQGLDWSITLDDQLVQAQYAVSDGGTGREDIEAEMRRKLLPEIERLTAFWKNPWKANGVSFEQWCNGIMEDHLVLDAVAVYPRMTYGGDLSAFELIDPTTIRLLIDYRGARPEPPFPAFQQDLYGFPRAEFGSCYADDDGTPAEGIAASSLFYFREQYRSFTPYGFSAVQQALISARLYLRRQGWMLAEYEDGSTPLTFLVPDATDGTMVEKLNPKTRQQWEDSINAMYSGQTRQRHRLKVLQPGMQPVQMQGVDERYKPDYDMHLIKMLAGHFGVTSTGLGFSESKGLGNSGLHEGQADVQQAATTKPDKRMIERIVNELMQTYQGAPAELRFKFTDPDVEDQAAEDASANAQRARGTITLNDDRKRIGKSPYTFPEADMPMALLGTGWVPIEGMAARAEQAAEAEQALVEDQLANSEATREATAMEAEAEELSGETAEKALELAAYRRWARKRGGDARRPFICKALAPSDWPGQDVPRDVDFADWAWVPDGLADDADDDMIMKSFGGGNDNWRTLARDSRGRWVKRGSMRVDALGPSTPDKPVLAGLARDAERRRAASATTSHRGGTISPVAASYGSAGGFRAVAADGKDLGTRADEHTARRALDAYAAGKPQPGAKPARETDAARMAASAGQAVDVTAGSSAADKLRRAEQMYGTDRSKWPAKARQDAARLERQLPVSEESSTIGGMTPKTPPPVPSRAERAAALNASAAAMMSGGPAPKGSMAERVMNRQDQSVRDVVNSLADAPGGIVAMADVRRKLRDEHGMDRGQQDAAIRRLVTTGDRSLNTFPEDNQKTITDADREAAIDLGTGEPQHLLSLDPPRAAEPKRYDVSAVGGASGERYDGPLRGDDDVMDLIEDMGRTGDGYASLEALRARMGGTHDEQTAALKRMDRARLIALDPDPLRATMTPERQAAAIQVGPEPKHLARLMDSRTPSSEQAAAARAVIDSVPGLREGVARQQPRTQRRFDDGPLTTSADDPGLTTVREATPTAGYALPTTPPAKPTPARHTATWKGQDVSVNSSKPFTHAAVVRWGDGTETVHSFHESETGAARGNLAASQKRTGARVVGVVEVKREGGAAADAGTPTPAAATPGAGAPGAQRFSVTLPDGTVQTSPPTRKGVRSAVVVTTDNAELARRASADAERRRRAGDAEGAARYERTAADFAAKPAQTHEVHWSTSDKPDTRRHTSSDSGLQRATVVAASPAARAEAIAASTPDAPSAPAEPALSKRQRDMAARFDQLAGEHAGDKHVAMWRQRAIDLTGEMEQVGSGALATRDADSIRSQMAGVQDEFTHAMAGARAAAAARDAGGDERAQKIANSRATLDSRARKATDEINRLEADIKAMAKPRGALSDPHEVARKRARAQLKTSQAERQRYLDRIESVERDHDTKLIYDESGKLVGTKYEPPAAPAAAPSINDMMAQQMAASVANPSVHGGAHGKVDASGIDVGVRVQFRGTAWKVEEKPRKAAVNAQGKGGVLFRATREDQGITSTMRLDEGKTIALAAPKGGTVDVTAGSSAADKLRRAEQMYGADRSKWPAKARQDAARLEGGGASRPKADAGAAPVTGAAALAAAPKDVEATGARGLPAKERDAIEEYRGKSFSLINGQLRSGRTAASTDRTAALIDRAMADSRLTSDVTVYRAVGDVNAIFGDSAKRKLDGAEWTDNAYQSTSAVQGRADTFLIGEGGKRTSARIVMRVPAGTGAVQLSDDRYEAELLLQRGLRMRVVSDTGPWRRGQKNPRIIEVEVIPA